MASLGLLNREHTNGAEDLVLYADFCPVSLRLHLRHPKDGFVNILGELPRVSSRNMPL